MDIEKIFSEMPSHIGEKGLAHHNAMKRERVADEQIKLWRKEQELAKLNFQATQADWFEVLSNYDPNTKESKNKIVIDPPTA